MCTSLKKFNYSNNYHYKNLQIKNGGEVPVRGRDGPKLFSIRCLAQELANSFNSSEKNCCDAVCETVGDSFCYTVLFFDYFQCYNNLIFICTDNFGFFKS